MNRSRSNIIIIVVMSLFVGFMFFNIMTPVLGLGMGLGAALLMGAMTAAVGAMSFGYRELLQQRAFKGKKQSGASTDSQQARTIEVDLPYDAAYDLALEALQSLHDQPIPVPDDILVQLENMLPRTQKLNIKSQDRDTGMIDARLRYVTVGITDVNDFAHIHLSVESIDRVTTRIHIESKPTPVAAFFGERYDLGKNLHYVTHLAKFIRYEAQSKSATERLDDKAAHVDDMPLVADDLHSESQQS